jgi:hypothetical protein
MKIAIWDILAILGLALLCGMLVLFLQIFINPYNALNPFPPPTLPAQVVLPSSTATLLKLPPTWTPGGTLQAPGELTMAPTQTLPPTSTGFSLPTFTSTFTVTPTPTNTPTVTLTPTITDTPTRTNTPIPTVNKTATALSLFATHVAQTEAAAAQLTADELASEIAATNLAASATADCLSTQTAGGVCP